MDTKNYTKDIHFYRYIVHVDSEALDDAVVAAPQRSSDRSAPRSPWLGTGASPTGHAPNCLESQDLGVSMEKSKIRMVDFMENPQKKD